ncbi:hypothetical protein ABIA32_006542 [Streptacidiphilus sp. MAP12-20]|uniref:SHOCT domain-containing protein n=1 Tax=Streptacidiphilus sp. MAP12-20 TaxID=3156299 RepID=UPI0035177B1C
MIGRPVARAGRRGLIGTAARTAVVAGTATAVSGRVAARQQQRATGQMAEQQPPAAQPPAPEPAPAASTGDSIADQLERLGALQTQGLITAEEFAAAKQRLLGL